MPEGIVSQSVSWGEVRRYEVCDYPDKFNYYTLFFIGESFAFDSATDEIQQAEVL